MNDVLKDAIAGYVSSVTAEPSFRAKLDESLNRMRQLFADPSVTPSSVAPTTMSGTKAGGRSSARD
jgi:hypothetical protein